jgi:sodium-coupled neutral amino acid transporter 1
MVYEKLGEQVFGTTGKLVIFGATSLQNTGGKKNMLSIHNFTICECYYLF